MIKPGWKSSEFWLTVVSFIFSGAYLVGVLDDHGQKEDLITETSRGVEAFILIMGQLAVLFRYIKGRTEIKKIWETTEKEEPKKSTTSKSVAKKKKKPVSRTTKKSEIK